MTKDEISLCPDCFGHSYRDGLCHSCGYAEAEGRTGNQALASGTLLGNRYLVGRVLGIGGFGITYKAFDTLHQQVCAVKEYFPSGLAFRRTGERTMRVYQSSFEASYQYGMMRFLEEAQMLRQLEGVPAVVQVQESFQENQTAYFAMEFLDGTNLKKVVQAAGNTIAAADILRIIAEIGTTMGRIHKTTRILHRDISPGNIYLLKDGRVKILDFGNAREQQIRKEQEFTVALTSAYAPPEQYKRTGKQGTYTDVYALASTCYYALTGRAVPDAMERMVGVTYVPLADLRPDVSPEVSEAVDRALVLDYCQRTQTMEEFVEGIRPGSEKLPEAEPEEKIRQPFLQIVSGTGTGTRWNLPADQEVKIGRSASVSNIILPGEPLISKVHCSLLYETETGMFVLRDYSKNGVFVDGVRLEPEKEYRYPELVEFSLAVDRCRIKAEVAYE